MENLVDGTIVFMDLMTLDDRSSGDLRSKLGTSWRLVADTVMGGVSTGQLKTAIVDGESCVCLTGQVRLENNGGFVQASLELAADASLDASGYDGVLLEVLGNGESYNVHLRTADTKIVWQSYRAAFVAEPAWQTVRLPFARFVAHRVDRPLDVRRLKRIGLVAIGRAFAADLCLKRLALYRE